MRIVWENLLDQKYPVRVVSENDPYSGTLQVLDPSDTTKVLWSESVTVSYGAKFGPDGWDVVAWSERCCEYVDSLKQLP